MRILFVLLFLSNSIFAQEDYSFNSLYRTFEEGQSFFVLNDQSKVHVAPFVTATSLATLPVGYKITVVERMDELFRINGFRTNWYRVAFQQNGVEEEGYLWGGNIAVGAFYAREQSDILFLYGIGKMERVSRGTYEEESLKIQLNACRNQKLLHGLQFEGLGTLYTNTEGKAMGNKGLANVQDVIEVAFSDGYCGGVSATITIFWDGQQLHYVELLSNGFSNEQFSNKYFIYPSDTGGKAGRIILRDEAGYYNDKREVVYSHQREKTYVWNGRSLVKKV